MRLFVVVVGAGTLVSLFSIIPDDARANGRFPEAQTFESVPGNDKTMFLRTTFGILVTRDGSESWRWICERALGYEGQWDPPIAVTRDGRLWVGLEDGIVSTSSDGCEIEASPELDTHTVKDLTTDPRGETLWAITGAPGKKSYVWRKSPGKKFERLAGMDDTNLMTIEVAPSQPATRVYLSGQPYTTVRGQIYRSDDGGQTFKTDTAASTSLTAEGPFFIGSVDQNDPNRLLIRHLHAAGSDLLRSSDGGKTFKNVLTMKSAMFGFAKGSDGKTFWVGSGLPEHGIFRSTDRGDTFESTAKHGVLCLKGMSDNNTLFACDNALTLGAFAIAVSHDQGKTVLPTTRFTDVKGPIECATPDARASLCASTWGATHASFTTAPPTNEESSDASANGNTKRKRSRDGGSPDAGDSAPQRAKSSCGCEVVGFPSPSTDLVLLIAGLIPLMLRVMGRIMRGSKLTQDTANCTN